MKFALVLISLAALAAPATPVFAAAKSAAAGRCFYMNDVRGHTVGDDHTLYLNVGGKSVYRVEMSNNCLGGSVSSDAIVLKQRGSANICEPVDLDIGATVNGGGLPSRCIVDKLTRLTPAEAAALPKKVQP